MKNVYTIEPDAPFLDRLATEIWRRAEGDGFRLSRHIILLPTRRACRHMGAAFARLAGGRPVLLPRLRPLGDVDEEEMAFAEAGGGEIAPAIAPLRRLMLLTQQVRRRDPDLSWDQAALAADALAKFLDQIQIERCDIDRLPELVQEQELAEHWRQTVVFLEIVTRNWPLIVAESGCIDPALRRNLVLEAQAETWRRQPPDFPVIAAGSTGSVPATADLLEVIASLPQGAVVLPGLDRGLDNEAWAVLDDTHPQHSMKRLLEKMGVDRQEVGDWGLSESATSSPRVRLLSEAMRPAAVTEAWRNLHGKLEPSAVNKLTRLTLDHPQEEAQVIALRLRALLETKDKTAALVTADRALASRVAALLRRWGIAADDSGGAPMALLPLGAFLQLVLAAASPYAGAVDALALLKHPLAACGDDPAACRAQARAAEIRARQMLGEDFAVLRGLLRPLSEPWHSAEPLAARIASHIAVAEAVAASDRLGGAARLWRGESGEEVAAWFDEWREAAVDFPELTGTEYAALFASLAAAKTLRPGRSSHPRLSILGPLEARLIDADLVVLGGMNEGQWPPDAGFDPWLSRPMRKKLALPSPEFRIGLSAHDFVQLAAGREVMLTRALRVDGTPTVPSRFLLQLDTVLRAAGLSDEKSDALKDATPWRAWARLLDAPQGPAMGPCARPRPCPPVALRPTRLSVTEMTTWLRNPYAIYAKHILKLKKLDELDAELDASDRGTMIHAALEEFIRLYPRDLPVDAESCLLEIGRKAFARAEANSRLRAFWWARFVDIAAWFVDEERRRRAEGTYPQAVEAAGRLQLGGLTLTGRVDRIDCLSSGEPVIIDYKTGAAPNKKEVESGIEPQLALLGLMSAAGAFDKVVAAPPAVCEYWILKGDSKIMDFDKQLPDLMKKAEEGVVKLATTFADPAVAYEASPRSRVQPRYNDYAHLSRLAEWSRAGDDT